MMARRPGPEPTSTLTALHTGRHPHFRVPSQVADEGAGPTAG
ncbi:hypothetical protein [Streptomyces glaucosporus]